jgi:hypothetical protein
LVLFSDQFDRTPNQPPSHISTIHGFTFTTAGACCLDDVTFTSDLHGRTNYIAKVHETNRPFNLSQFERNGITHSQWAITDRIRLLDALKAEHFFIQFLPKPSGINSVFYETNLRHKIFQIHAFEEKNRSTEKDSSFVVSTSSPQGRQTLSLIPSDDYTFKVVVPSDIEGEHGHTSGIAKYAFLVSADNVVAL